MRAQLDLRSKYFAELQQLIKANGLSLSSGSMRHLVRVDKSGEIKRWPLIEGSLTPTPANPLAEVDFASVKAHFAAAGVDLPDLDDLKATLDAAARNDLSDADFAYIDAQGGRHLPINDEAHCRAALSRFEQTMFESAAAKAKAKRKLIAKCKELGIDVSEDFMGGKAAELADLIAAVLDDDQAAKAFDAVNLADHADYTAQLAAALTQRTKDLHERRVKEGRTLSTVNRSRLAACHQSMQQATADLGALLDSTDPAKAEAKALDLQRLRAQFLALQLRSMICEN